MQSTQKKPASAVLDGSIHEKLQRITADLEHLKKRGGYTAADIIPLQEQLLKLEIDGGITNGVFCTGTISGRQAAILASALHRAYRLAAIMLRGTETDPAYTRVLDELEDIEHGLQDLTRSGEHQPQSLLVLQKRLDIVDSSRCNNAFVDGHGGVLPGQAYLHDLLAYNYSLLEDLQTGSSNEPVDERLCHYKKQLEQTLMQLRQQRKQKHKSDPVCAPELANFREVLLDVESHRIGGVFQPPGLTTSQPQSPLKGQAYLSSLLHRAFRELRLLEASTEVAPEIEPLSIQLEDLNELLLSYKRNHNYTSDQLRQAQNKLDELDSLRKSSAAAFVVNRHIPAGQAYLHGLLASCYSIAYQLQAIQP